MASVATLPVGMQTILSPILSTQKLIYAFDLDHTLIRPTNGAKFCNYISDWEFMPMVEARIKEIRAAGHSIFIFTNQKRGVKPDVLAIILNRIHLVLFKLGLSDNERTLTDNCHDINVCISVADYSRKPLTFMYEQLCQLHRASAMHPNVVDIKNYDIVYVGDAAGRPGDFSASDYEFAWNCKFGFKTNTGFFENVDADVCRYSCKYLEEINLESVATCALTLTPYDEIVKCLNTHVRKLAKIAVIMVGAPASGKSTFVERLGSDIPFCRVNQDKLKSKARCLKVAKQFADMGANIIIDNTNPSVASRAEYIKIIQAGVHKYTIFAIVLATSKQLTNCLNNLRVSINPYSADKIPAVAYNIYYKKYSNPTAAEGFDQIYYYRPNFVFADVHKHLRIASDL
jgi:bifunctional polynucleotide phosphatase/kinase